MFQYKKVIFLSFLLIINLVKSQTPEEIQEKIKLQKKPLMEINPLYGSHLIEYKFVAKTIIKLDKLVKRLQFLLKSNGRVESRIVLRKGNIFSIAVTTF